MTNVRDENLRLALVKAVADEIAAGMTQLRASHLEALVEQYDETGNKSFSVRLPNGMKVATITLPEGKEYFEVANEAEFLAWMRQNHPDTIETVTVPPQPEMTYEQVSPKAATALLKSLTAAGEGAIDVAGEIVPGVQYHPVKTPSSFSVRYEPEGKARVIDAWRTGELAGLVGTDVLPQIGGAK